MHGQKTGGRQRGTPNKRTLEAQQVLAELGCDPIEGMARIAMDQTNSPELRRRMHAELAGYAYPKRKAVEVTNIEERETNEEAPRLAKILSSEELRELQARAQALLAKRAEAEAATQRETDSAPVPRSFPQFNKTYPPNSSILIRESCRAHQQIVNWHGLQFPVTPFFNRPLPHQSTGRISFEHWTISGSGGKHACWRLAGARS